MGIEEERGRRKEGRGEDQSFGVLGRHPEIRAESTTSTSLDTNSAAARTGGLPCVDLGVGEEVAGTGAEEERQGIDEGQVRTKISVFAGGLPETRAESTISIKFAANFGR